MAEVVDLVKHDQGWDVAVGCDIGLGKLFQPGGPLEGRTLDFDLDALQTFMDSRKPRGSGQVLFVAETAFSENDDRDALKEGFIRGHHYFDEDGSYKIGINVHDYAIYEDENEDEADDIDNATISSLDTAGLNREIAHCLQHLAVVGDEQLQASDEQYHQSRVKSTLLKFGANYVGCVAVVSGDMFTDKNYPPGLVWILGGMLISHYIARQDSKKKMESPIELAAQQAASEVPQDRPMVYLVPNS